MIETIKKAGPAQRVLIDPNGSFGVRLAATEHNLRASHEQKMQHSRRK